MMRPGELNEVIEEADEDVSDDPVSSHGYDQIPGKIHFRGESATIKGKPTINQEYRKEISPKNELEELYGTEEPPSMVDSTAYEPGKEYFKDPNDSQEELYSYQKKLL